MATPPRKRPLVLVVEDDPTLGDVMLTALWDVAGLRIAFALWAERGPDATRLSTETRVLALSRAARIRFRLYWLAVGPFSALIRRRWLAAAKRRAEVGDSRAIS